MLRMLHPIILESQASTQGFGYVDRMGAVSAVETKSVLCARVTQYILKASLHAPFGACERIKPGLYHTGGRSQEVSAHSYLLKYVTSFFFLSGEFQHHDPGGESNQISVL